jgi:hypothetical protein
MSSCKVERELEFLLDQTRPKRLEGPASPMPKVVIPGVRGPFGGRTGRAVLSITPYMNRAGYCRKRNYYSKFTLLQ